MQYGHSGGKWQEGLAPSEELGKRSLERIIQTETWRISTRWEKPFKAEETKGLKLKIEKEQSRFKSGEFWEKVNICICVTSLIVGQESPCNAGDPSSIPGSGRSTGEGIGYPLQYSWASLVAQLVKNLPAVQETLDSIPGSGRSRGEVNGYSLHYSCLENSMDRGAWQTIVHGVTKSQTWLSY